MAAGGSSERPDQRIGPGLIVLVVGPSGAGKDSVIAGVRATIEDRGGDRFIFPSRIITRGAHAAEAHEPVSQTDFDASAAIGAYALSWHAHGLAYGIPARIDEHIRDGHVVIVNTSRGVVTAARQRYADVRVVLIDAPYATRADRLAARGRESRAEIEQRLTRAVAFDPSEADLVIDNGGSLDSAVLQFLAWLERQTASAV